MVNWDTILSIVIILFIVLIIWARISKQTVAEVIGDIKDMIMDKGEDIEEGVGGIIEYE